MDKETQNRQDWEQVDAWFYAARAGDGEAFAGLYRAFWDFAYYHCLRSMGNEHDAQDATQEAFLVLHKRLGSIPAPQYLKKAVRFAALDACKKQGGQRRKTAVDFTVLEQAEHIFEENDEFLPGALLDRKESVAQVMELVEKLPGVQRETLFFFYFNEFSVKEISLLQKKSINTVNSNLRKAKESLKAKMSAHLGGGIGLMGFGFMPILTQLFLRDMKRICTPELEQTVLSGLDKKLAAQSTGQSPPKPGNTGMTVALAVAATVTILCGAFAGYQFMTHRQADTIETAEQSADIIVALQNVETQQNLDAFLQTWGFEDVNRCRVDGIIYSVYYKTVDDVTILVGGSLTPEGVFTVARQVVEGNAEIPRGDGVKQWTIDN